MRFGRESILSLLLLLVFACSTVSAQSCFSRWRAAHSYYQPVDFFSPYGPATSPMWEQVDMINPYTPQHTNWAIYDHGPINQCCSNLNGDVIPGENMMQQSAQPTTATESEIGSVIEGLGESEVEGEIESVIEGNIENGSGDNKISNSLVDDQNSASDILNDEKMKSSSGKTLAEMAEEKRKARQEAEEK